jgi:hypothetical protein
MISQVKSGAFLGAVLAASAIAGPVAVGDVQIGSTLQERDLITLGSYNLSTTHEKDTIVDLYVIVLIICRRIK